MIPASSPYPPGVVIVVTGELTRYAKFNQDLNALLVPRGSAGVWFSGPVVKRNIDSGFQRFLDTPGMEWAWLIGDDHSFPRDILLKLLARGKECVVPLCLNRVPPITTTICRHDSGGSTDLDSLSGELYRLVETETCGDAGILLSRKAVEASGPPWQDEPNCGTWNIEDQRFIRKLRDRGIEVFVDLENVLGHITPVELVPVRTVDGHWTYRVLSQGKRLI